jgi:hypothetical protein
MSFGQHPNKNGLHTLGSSYVIDRLDVDPNEKINNLKDLKLKKNFAIKISKQSSKLIAKKLL